LPTIILHATFFCGDGFEDEVAVLNG